LVVEQPAAAKINAATQAAATHRFIALSLALP
jgi:hypothetical protein